jgi:hypothetical protein
MEPGQVEMVPGPEGMALGLGTMAPGQAHSPTRDWLSFHHLVGLKLVIGSILMVDQLPHIGFCKFS